LKKVESDITQIRKNEFKPNENLKKDPARVRNNKENGPEGI
jgi:hypothetical protein